MTTLKLFLFFWLFHTATSTHIRSADIVFEIDLQSDKDFINTNFTQIQKTFIKLEKYFKIKPLGKLNIEIKTFEKNSTFHNCARIYETKKIYLHSLESLKNLSKTNLSKINPSCITQSYEDQVFALIHEYIHVLTLLKIKDKEIPNWLWEGVAVALSGELVAKNSQQRRFALKEISKLDSINFCSKAFSKFNVYSIAGPTLFYYNKKSKNFILKLLKNYNSKDFNIEKFMKKEKLSCILTSKNLNEFI